MTSILYSGDFSSVGSVVATTGLTPATIVSDDISTHLSSTGVATGEVVVVAQKRSNQASAIWRQAFSVKRVGSSYSLAGSLPSLVTTKELDLITAAIDFQLIGYGIEIIGIGVLGTTIDWVGGFKWDLAVSI